MKRHLENEMRVKRTAYEKKRVIMFWTPPRFVIFNDLQLLNGQDSATINEEASTEEGLDRERSSCAEKLQICRLSCCENFVTEKYITMQWTTTLTETVTYIHDVAYTETNASITWKDARTDRQNVYDHVQNTVLTRPHARQYC